MDNLTLLRHQARYYELLACQFKEAGDHQAAKEYTNLASFLTKQAGDIVISPTERKV